MPSSYDARHAGLWEAGMNEYTYEVTIVTTERATVHIDADDAESAREELDTMIECSPNMIDDIAVVTNQTFYVKTPYAEPYDYHPNVVYVKSE